MKKKESYPKRKANYSIQFWLDKYGTLNMTETCQGGDMSKKGIDFAIFGMDIADSQLLEQSEKDAFVSFCNGYLSKYYERQRNKSSAKETL